MVAERVRDYAEKLRDDCSALISDLIEEQEKLDVIYNPLRYAWRPHSTFIERFAGLGARTLMIGMNPGLGMGNTGIPFGCPVQVRDYLGIRDLEVDQPEMSHPKRVVLGLEQPRSEVSGRRIWSMLAELYGEPETAMSHVFIVNHCPLWMFNDQGQNITPDKLRGVVESRLRDICDEHLREVVKAMGIERVIGVGNYAMQRATTALAGRGLRIEKIPHPSPASPLANRNGGADWRAAVREVLPDIRASGSGRD